MEWYFIIIVKKDKNYIKKMMKYYHSVNIHCTEILIIFYVLNSLRIYIYKILK
jgi:hypothetical protein